MKHVVIPALLWTGVAVTVLSSLSALVVREPFARLHVVGPAALLGAPLVCVAVMLDLGATRTSAKVAVIGLLVAGVQPALTAATGHGLALARGLVTGERESE